MPRDHEYLGEGRAAESQEARVLAAHDRYVRLMIEQGEPKHHILDLAAMKQVVTRGGGQIYDHQTRTILSAAEVWRIIEQRGIQVGSKVRLAASVTPVYADSGPGQTGPEFIVTGITPRRCQLRLVRPDDATDIGVADPSAYEVVEPFAVEHKQLYDRYVEIMLLQRIPENKILSYVQLQRRDPLDGKTYWHRITTVMREDMRVGSRVRLVSEQAGEGATVFTIAAITPTGKLKIYPKRVIDTEYPDDFRVVS